MKLFNNKQFLLAFLMLVFCSAFKAIDLEESKKYINKSFAIDRDSYVEIENKYGDIVFESWDKDSVSFDIEIIARSEKPQNLQDMLAKIDVEFMDASSFVIAETQWADNVSFFTKRTYDLKQGLGSQDKIEVNYVVKIPNWISLDVTNRFGNVYLTRHFGDVEVFVSYGDFRAREIKKGKKIEVKYGKLKVKTIDYGNIILSGAKSADIEEAGELIVESSSSEIEIEEIKKINIRSKHDEIFIESIEELQGTFTLSDTKIQNLRKNMSTSMKMGSLRIIEADAMANKISIEANKADIFVGVPDYFDGQVELDLTNDPTALEYPKTMEIMQTGVDGDKRLIIKGKLGTGDGPLVQVTNTQGFVQIGN